MVLLYAATLLILSFILLILRRNKDALLLFLECAALSVFLASILMYIAKKGGFPQQMESVLFLTKGIRNLLQYHVILLKNMGLIVALGRYLFPFFFFWIALDNVTIFNSRTRKTIRILAPILPIVSFVLYTQPVFESVIEVYPKMQKILVNASYTWVLSYIIAAIFLYAFEYSRIKISFTRRKFLQKTAMHIGMAGLFIIYCRQDPAQIYMFYYNDYMWELGLWYLSPIMDYRWQLLLLLFMLICTALSMTYMVRFAVLELSEKRETHEVYRKFAIAKEGSNIFVHSIKNQLLAEKVLYRRMMGELDKENPSIAMIRKHAQDADSINTTMMEHINELYQSFREHRLTMNRTNATELIIKTKESLYQKHPNAKVNLKIQNEYEILSDESKMVEALLNLLLNAWEATCMKKDDHKPIDISIYQSQMYVVICIQDYGIGINPSLRKRIFEPFFTQKNSNSSWGMGLYYSKALIKSHYGSLHVESKEGEGTKMYVLLPLYRVVQKEVSL